MQNRILDTSHLILTGERKFLERYASFLNSLEKHFPGIESLPVPGLQPAENKRWLLRQLWHGFPLLQLRRHPPHLDPHRSSWAFRYKSRRIQKNLEKKHPGLVLQLFGMFASGSPGSSYPFVMSLDYTMALAEQNYPGWAAFTSSRQRDAWMKQERETYAAASWLFPWSRQVAHSLEADYGMDPGKIVVTGSGGNLTLKMQGVKRFGSRTLLVNGSDFYRKGADIALEALRRIRREIPDVHLKIIGTRQGPEAEQVTYLGFVTGEEARLELFREADLVLAPARCDPFPGFLIEAMQCGTPCVVSDRDGLPEIVDHGVNGIVVKDLDPDTWASELILLLRDPKKLQQFSIAAKNKVTRTLNWDQVANTIAETLKNTNGGPGR